MDAPRDETVESHFNGNGASRAPQSAGDRQAWRMPLDEYRASADTVRNYAEQLLLTPCLERAGYDWPVPWQDVNELPADTMNAYGRRLFNEEIAAKWGYHTGAEPSRSELAWEDFRRATEGLAKDPVFNDVITRCFVEVRAEFPLIPMDDQLFANDLAIEAEGRAQLDSSVQSAAKRWNACMRGLGLADLPESPTGMPTRDLAEKFGLSSIATPATPGAVSDEEIRIATADASCAESSGYAQATYDAEWREQSVGADRERVKLERIREEIDRQRRQALQVIAENAPVAPS